MVIVGVPGALTLAGLMTIFQRSTEDAYRGRVFGAFSAIEGIAMLSGTLTAGYLSRPLGIIPVLAVQGAGYVLAGLGMTVWLHHRGDPGQARIPAGNAARTRKQPVQKEPLGGIVRP